MSKCKVYPEISREAVNSFRRHAEQSGHRLPDGDSFVTEARGVRMSVDYVEAQQTLTLCIVHKGLLPTEKMVWDELDSQMHQAEAST
jgi:hypothetical protein